MTRSSASHPADNASDEYFPHPSFYDPHISVKQWEELLRNPEVTTAKTLDLLQAILACGGEASCAQLASRGKFSASYYNSEGKNFGRRVKQKLHLPDCLDHGVNRLFVFPFLGRKIDGGRHYAWKLRDELKQALNNTGLSSPSTFKEKRHCSMEKNIILYGPPGTGKTYHTHMYAVAIIEDRPLEDVTAEPHDAVLERFNKYRQQGLIEFTTFHQSYSYEDFVEGIRPVIQDDDADTNGPIAYRVEAGVFKNFCDKAATSSFTETLRAETSPADNAFLMNDAPVIWKVSLAGTKDNPVRTECLKKGHIRIGWDLYGKDITEETDFSKGGKAILDAFIHKMQPGDIVVSCYTESTTDAIGIITGDYEWHDEYPEYKRVRNVHWLIKNVRQDILELNNGIKMTLSTVYQLKNVNLDELLSIVKEHLPGQNATSPAPAERKKERRVFIIDEINRGNIAGIFGELITLIEPSKRLGAEEALKVRLPYSRKEFGVPDNIYLLGTMNTADRSLTGLDIALRRRFAFRKMPPCPELLSDRTLCSSGFSLADVLSVMNRRIAALLDQDHCLGHAPFLTLPKGNVPVQALARIFRNSVLPLLEEYFFDDWNKIRLILNDHRKEDNTLRFIDAAGENRELFGHDVEAARDEWVLNEDAFFQTDAYVQIIDAEAGCPGEGQAGPKEKDDNDADGSALSRRPGISPSGSQRKRYGDYEIVRYDSGAVEVYSNGVKEPSAIKILKNIASELGVSTLSSVGTPLNTRALGKHVLDYLEESSRT